jgi:hypothetical protein
MKKKIVSIEDYIVAKSDNVVFVDAAEVRRARPKNCLFKGD